MASNPEAPKPARDPAALRDVKVRLPVGHVQKLHSLKVLRGQLIETTIRDALDQYFARVEVPT